MIFDIENCPFIPFNWLKLKLSQDDYIYSSNTQDLDVFVKIADRKHYMLSLYHKDDIQTITFEVRECIGEFSDTSLKIPGGLSHDNEKFPLCTSDTIIERKNIFINNDLRVNRYFDKIRVPVPSFFTLTSEKGKIKNFEIKNVKFLKDEARLEFVLWQGVSRCVISPENATIEHPANYDTNFNAGLKHIIGNDNEVSILHYNKDGICFEKNTHLNTGIHCFYSSLLYDILHFSFSEREDADRRFFTQMNNELQNIRNMDSRHCTKAQAFDNFHNRWTRAFNFTTPNSYILS